MTKNEKAEAIDTLISFIIAIPLTWGISKYLIIPLFNLFNLLDNYNYSFTWWMYLILFLFIMASCFGGISKQRAIDNIAYNKNQTIKK